MFVIVKTEFPAPSHEPATTRFGGTGVLVGVRVGVAVGVTQTADAEATTTFASVRTSTRTVP